MKEESENPEKSRCNLKFTVCFYEKVWRAKSDRS